MARTPVTDELAELANLGPASARMLREAGVRSVEELQEIGAVAAWRQLRFALGPRVTLNFLYALEAALAGMDWRDIPTARKTELRIAAERIKDELRRRR